MIRPLDEYSPEDRKFVEYVEYLRRQPPRPGFPRKSFTELATEQGVGPINVAELKAILRDYRDNPDVDESTAASP